MANHVAHGCSYHLRGTVVLHCRGTLSPCVCGDGIGCGADRGASRGRVATQRLSSHRGGASVCSTNTHHSIRVQVNPLPLHEIGRIHFLSTKSGTSSPRNRANPLPLHERGGTGETPACGGQCPPLHEKQFQPFTNDTPTNIAGGVLFFRARRTERMSAWNNRIRDRIQ